MIDLQNCAIFVTGALLLCQQAPAQEDRQTPARALEQRFNSAAIKTGEAFPEVDIYDEKGEKFNTRSLKGKYTVVVNGCLT